MSDYRHNQYPTVYLKAQLEKAKKARYEQYLQAEEKAQAEYEEWKRTVVMRFAEDVEVHQYEAYFNVSNYAPPATHSHVGFDSSEYDRAAMLLEMASSPVMLVDELSFIVKLLNEKPNRDPYGVLRMPLFHA